MLRLPAVVLALLVAACGGSPSERISECVATESLVPICGFRHPEDIELLPDGQTLVISQMGDMEGSSPGTLVLYDTVSGLISRLPLTPPVVAPLWGASDCKEAPGVAFSPHGIDLLQRPDGALELLVVNHGGRESVELFEFKRPNGVWQIAWRGCVVPPPGTWMNDVAALPDTTFIVSHMFPRSSLRIGAIQLDMLKGAIGFDTGHALRCGTGVCTRVPGTEAPFPNGVQVDAAGRTLYLNAYLANEVRAIDISTGKLLGTARIHAPDNAQWDAAGRLLVASQTASWREMSACFAIHEGACGASFEIVALDPATMQTQTILAHAGAPMGAATVAQQVGQELYIGSFAGDRILRAPATGPLPQPAEPEIDRP